jgi:nucleoside-diphosphate-sugar epimerase
MLLAVAGGRGFIGAHVVAAALRAGHEPLVTGRGEAIPSAADAVVHLGLFSEADAAHALAPEGARRRRWVIASSGDVYRRYGWLLGNEADPGPPGPLDEDAPLRTQLYPYGRHAQGPRGELVDYDKILVECAGRAAGAVVLRLPKVYGPGSSAPFGAWLERLSAGQQVRVAESVAAWRWTHGYVEDVAEALVLAAQTAGIDGRVYNVGETATPTLRARIEALAAAAGRPGAVAVVPDQEVPPDLRVPILRVADLVYDTRRVRAELGWQEWTPPDEALRRTVAAFLRG